MLNKPKFMTPSTNMPIKVVDAKSENIPFSCIVDGNEGIYAWRIRVFLLETFDMVIDTEKRILDDPFFPIDEKNRNVIFEQDIKGWFTNINNEISTYLPAKRDEWLGGAAYYTSNKNTFPYTYTKKEFSSQAQYQNWFDYGSNEDLFYIGTISINSNLPFFWTIEFWNCIDKDNETPTVVSCEEVFYINDTPTPKIQYGLDDTDSNGGHKITYKDLSDESIVNSKKCYFKGSYEQSSTNAPLKCYGWRIIDKNTKKILFDTITKNRIYGIADNISACYDGFLNNHDYTIELYIETQNGVSVITEPTTFTTSYATSFIGGKFKAEISKEEPSVVLDWSDVAPIQGDSEGNVFFIKNYPVASDSSVVIPENSSITYGDDNSFAMDITEDSYIVLSTQLSKNIDTVLFETEGIDKNGNRVSRMLSYSGGKLYYSIVTGEGSNINSSYSIKNLPSEQVWYVILLPPADDSNGIIVTESVAVNGRYPSGTLYPSDNILPYHGEWSS